MATEIQQTRGYAIRQALSRHAAVTPDSAGVAQAVIQTWRRMSDQVEPVVGARGVDVLFDRSLHLTAKSFPWLAAHAARGNSAASLESIQASFAARHAHEATDGGSALLSTFVDLLADLIGDSLTERLLGVVWTSSHPSPIHERQS